MKKKLFLFIFLMVSCSEFIYCSEPACVNCCPEVRITHEFTSNCCLKINVFNLCCGKEEIDVTTMYIKIKQWNSITQTFDSINFIPAISNHFTSFTLCPNAGDNFIKYKLYMCQEDGPPYCGRIPPIIFEEGFNMFTDSVSTTTCCQCPSSSVLEVTVNKSNRCVNHGCLVTLTKLTLPPEDVCYTNYKVKWGSEPVSAMKSLSTDPLIYNSYCLSQGSILIIRLYLFKEGETNIDLACRITKIINCVEDVPNPDTTAYTCTPDCPDSLWKADRSLLLEISPGCHANVTFTYRKACVNQFQDLQVKEIQMTGDCSINMTKREIYQKAVVALVKANPMGFYPQVGAQGCNPLWRLIKSTCWKNYYCMGPATPTHPYGTVMNLVLQQCDTGECCVQQYTVCRDAQDAITMTPMGISMFPTTSLCSYESDSVIVIGPWGLPIGALPNTNCHTTCDWVNITNMGYIIPPAEAKASANTGTNENMLTINCSSEQKCDLRIEFYDLIGNLTLTYKRTLQNTVNDLDINSLIEQKGIYIYRVYVNDFIIKNGKIIK